MRVVTHAAVQGQHTYPIYQMSNAHGTEVITTPYRAALLSVCTPNNTRVLPLLHAHYDRVKAYLRNLSTVGALCGPVGFPHAYEKAIIGRRAHTLPSPGVQVDFNTVKWKSTVRCMHNACSVQYFNTPNRDNVACAVAHTIDIKFNQDNQLFVQYTSRSKAKALISLAHDNIWDISQGHNIFGHRVVVNAEYFGIEPLLTEITGECRINRQGHTIHKRYEGYYKLCSTNVTDKECGFADVVEELTPAIMMSDIHTRRYMRMYTNFPLLRISICRTAQKRAYGVRCTPCIPLDSTKIIAKRNHKHTFRCCYEFGTW